MTIRRLIHRPEPAGPGASGSRNSTQISSFSTLKRYCPYPVVTVIPSSGVATARGEATCVMVRCHEARQESYWPGWQDRQALEETKSPVAASMGRCCGCGCSDSGYGLR